MYGLARSYFVSPLHSVRCCSKITLQVHEESCTHGLHVGLDARHLAEAEVVNLLWGHVGAGVVAQTLLVQRRAVG